MATTRGLRVSIWASALAPPVVSFGVAREKRVDMRVIRATPPVLKSLSKYSGVCRIPDVSGQDLAAFAADHSSDHRIFLDEGI
jgi:hypothetical protein